MVKVKVIEQAKRPSRGLERGRGRGLDFAVKREKFAKNKKNASKERLSLLLFKV